MCSLQRSSPVIFNDSAAVNAMTLPAIVISKYTDFLHGDWTITFSIDHVRHRISQSAI